MSPAAAAMKDNGGTIRAFGRRRLLDCLKDLSGYGSAALAHETATHSLRVALRRLENGLDLFKSFLPRAGVKSVREEVREISKRAGKVRDCDLVLRVAPAITGSIDARLLMSLVARRERRIDRLVWKPAKTVERWRKLLEI